jgi:hypothetical protein
MTPLVEYDIVRAHLRDAVESLSGSALDIYTTTANSYVSVSSTAMTLTLDGVDTVLSFATYPTLGELVAAFAASWVSSLAASSSTPSAYLEATGSLDATGIDNQQTLVYRDWSQVDMATDTASEAIVIYCARDFHLTTYQQCLNYKDEYLEQSPFATGYHYGIFAGDYLVIEGTEVFIASVDQISYGVDTMAVLATTTLASVVSWLEGLGAVVQEYLYDTDYTYFAQGIQQGTYQGEVNIPVMRGTALAVRFDEVGEPTYTQAFTPWTLVYQAGYSTIPTQVQSACVDLALRFFQLYEHDRTLKQETLADFASVAEKNILLHPSIKNRLDLFREVAL